MRAVAASLPIPCLGNAEPYYSKTEPAPSQTIKKVTVVFSCFLFAAGPFLLSAFPPVGIACLAAAGIGIICGLLYEKFIESKDRTPSKLEPIEQLEPAKQLAGALSLPPALEQELNEVIPTVDDLKPDSRIASIQYNLDQTATFSLSSAPHLQFCISAPDPSSRLGCKETVLAHRYENSVYAYEICQREGYTHLSVPSQKPIYLQVGGLRRALLMQETTQKQEAQSVESLELALRQMVRFLLQTGDTGLSDPLPFIPLEGGKLSLQNLYHLTDELQLTEGAREHQQVQRILDSKRSLIASLDREDLIDIALDELNQRHSSSLDIRQRYPDNPNFALEIRQSQIQKAKQQRLADLKYPVLNPPAPRSPLHNHLNISVDELGLDLSLTDYAVMSCQGNHTGTCRIITLKEVAQAVLDRINQKIEQNPQQERLEFTPKDLLIGKDLPHFDWRENYQYNLLQGLGYKSWPDPHVEPPYWMALILQALKEKGKVIDFSVPRPYDGSPWVQINLQALSSSK